MQTRPRPQIEQLETRRLLCGYHAAAVLFDVSPTGSAALRVDSAATGPFTDSSAQVWAADYGFSGGNPATTVFAVAGTTDDSLYYTARYGKSFSYSFAVPNGQYTLTLLFAETYAPNQRKFDVSAEGALILNDIDLSAAYGTKVAIQRNFDVSIADGRLNLQFTGVLGNATIAGIALFAKESDPDPDPVPPPDPGVAPLAPSNLLATAASSSQVQLSWNDNSNNETRFEIERATGGGVFAQIATTSADVKSYTDSGRSAGTTYSYRVRAANGQNSPYSNTAKAITPVANVTWKTVASSPIVRAESPGAVVNGKAYVFGGFQVVSGKIVAIKRSDKYDPATNKWTRIADMPEPITHSGMAVDGKTIWVVAGYLGDDPGPGVKTVYKYDTVANTWSRGPDLPAERGGGAAAIVGRELHFVGGMDKNHAIHCGEHWALDLDNTAAGWVEKAPITNKRNHTAAASVNGMLYVVGGQHFEAAAEQAQSQVDRYDPSTDTWTQVASLPEARSHTTSSTFAMNGKIIIVGGANGSGNPKRTVYSYDPAADTWTTIALLPAARSTVVAGAINAKQIISATGNGPSPTKDAWIGTLS